VIIVQKRSVCFCLESLSVTQQAGIINAVP